MAQKKSSQKKSGRKSIPNMADQVRAEQKGTLIIIGGKEDKEGEREILQLVAERAGSGKLVVATVATDVPDELWKEYRELFGKLGARKIEHLNIRTREEALAEDCARIMEDAEVLFFTGGDQLKITSQLGDSMVFRKTIQLLEKGGTVAGTSAGASVMSTTMLVSGQGDKSPNIEDVVRMAPGLGLFPDAVVDQHFAERGRIGRLVSAISQNPRHLGVGIDEDTAIVVHGLDYFEVVGRGAVYVLDASQMTYTNLVEGAKEEMEATLSSFNIKLHLLGRGFRFDLRNRQPILPVKQEDEKKTA
jgi:cyanophycinase